ncbi:hypothetical protein K227x_59250 [Rubripirellula lacrimiformis]|uniref:ParG n=1 Tax=Rubripirellula lacrimiformis TaxID=1930273 RepID=A0A517NK34_9BACT|nr:plasmid partition protein ParG [Rubripirellula lacrimiformis]QDT07498.1 hypothetical protein K227x_59250 [Rubripirellula lacrimiformis]
MSKQIKMQVRPSRGNEADQWVEARKVEPEFPPVKMKRLTIDIDPDLHTKLKVHCAMKETEIVSLMRELIQNELGAE